MIDNGTHAYQAAPDDDGWSLAMSVHILLVWIWVGLHFKAYRRLLVFRYIIASLDHEQHVKEVMKNG